MWPQVPYCKREAGGVWLQRRRCEGGGKRLGALEEGATSQGMWWPPEAGKDKQICMGASRRSRPCQHLDLRL